VAKLKEIEQVFIYILREDNNRDEINKRIQQFDEDDWRGLFELVTKHGLFPVFYNRLLSLKLENTPPEFLFRLKNAFLLNLQRNILLERELSRILIYFKELNIPAIPLKGPILARYLYNDLGLRQAPCDLDILVRSEQFEAAEDALSKINYIPCNNGRDTLFQRNLKLKYARQLSFSCNLVDGTGVLVELHVDLRGLFVYFPLEYFWRNLKEFDLDGNKILMPTNETLLIYLSLVSMTLSEFIELRYLYDIYRLILKFKSELDWLKITESIKNTRHKTAVFFSLTLSQYFFYFAIPKDFLRIIKPNIIKRFLLRIWINKNNVLYKRTNRDYSWYCFFTAWHYFVTSYLYSKSILDCIKIIRSKIFLPMNEMVGRYSQPLSNASRSLYIKRLLKPISRLLKKGVVYGR
jgi:hypothetical protein